MECQRPHGPTLTIRTRAPASSIYSPGKRDLRSGWYTAVLLVAALSVPVSAQPFATTQAPGPVTETTATLNGMATPNGSPTVAWFEWGTNSSYGQTTTPVDVGSGFGVVHLSVPITGLTPSAISHY